MKYESDHTLISGMLSKTTTFRIIVNGPVSENEIQVLIRKLKIDRDLFADECKNKDIESCRSAWAEPEELEGNDAMPEVK